MTARVFPHVGTLPPGLSGIPVVIDALRATSTIVAAVRAGATAVRPVGTVAEALALQQSGRLLAGERGGFRPTGFDLGNSPLEMTPEAVGGRELVLTTTNGSLALLEARSVGPVLCASFLNLGAVCRYLRESHRDVVILCAGSEGRWSSEDFCVAGGIVDGLDGEQDDFASVARIWYQSQRGDLVQAVRNTQHGRFLCQAGFEADVEFCAKLDWTSLVPIYDVVIKL
jgi:2-phosphosulfolactate phosphatase